MRKLKVSLSAMALLLGIGSAVATAKHHTLSNRIWGKDAQTGLYTDVTGQQKGTDFTCTGTSVVCTEEYPSDVNPNNQSADAHPGVALPSNTVMGIFAQ